MTLEGVLLAKASNNANAGTAIIKISRDGGSTIENEIRAMADGSILFKKTSKSSADVAQALFDANGALTIPGKLESNGATFKGSVSGTSANFSGKVEGDSISSSGDIVSSKAVQGESIKASFAQSDSGNTLFKALMDGAEIFRILRDSNDVIRFAVNDVYPLLLHEDGTAEATALMTSLIKNNNNIQLKYSGGADVTLSKSSSGTAGYWRPTSDKNESNLGSASYKWNTVYATNTSTQSDRKDKREIEGIEKALDFIMNLQPVQYKFKNSSTKQGRTHYGFIAQDVATIAKDLGVNLSLARAAHVIQNEDGTIEDGYYDGSADVPDEELSWSLDYNEFIAPLVSVVQEQQRKIEELEKRLKSLGG